MLNLRRFNEKVLVFRRDVEIVCLFGVKNLIRFYSYPLTLINKIELG